MFVFVFKPILRIMADEGKTGAKKLKISEVCSQASRLECLPENCFSYFSAKTYFVGTQKNRLNETVLLSTQNICLNIHV